MQYKFSYKPNQCKRILTVLREAKGKWISGRYFLQTMLISQYHSRIFELQDDGYFIEASKEVDEFGFKSYRLTKDKKEPEVVVDRFF